MAWYDSISKFNSCLNNGHPIKQFHGISNHKIPTRIHTHFYAEESGDQEQSNIDLSILTNGVDSALPYKDLGLIPKAAILPDAEHIAHPVEGMWTGTLFHGNLFERPFMTLCLCIDVLDNRVSGRRILHTRADHSLTGHLEAVGLDEEITKINFQVLVPHESVNQIVTISGEYSHPRDIIEGHCQIEVHHNGDHASSRILREGAFLLTRSPPHAFRFLDLLHQPSAKDDTSSKLARRRWTFATQAVIFKVQEQRSTWKFIRERISERNAWIEIYMKCFKNLGNVLTETRGFMSADDLEKSYKFITKIHPINRQIYDTAANYLYERKWYSM